MSDKTYMGGPAFPDPARGHAQGHPNDALGSGMTLWDYYAAAALTGCCVNDTERNFSSDDIAEEAARIADAMLAEHAKRTGST